MNLIPINIEDLLSHRTIEQSRIEYKGTWDKQIELKTLRTMCAFANDIQNLNGGYIIVGIDTENVTPLLPPRGIPENQLEKILQDIHSLGKSRLDPAYNPIAQPIQYQDKWIVVIWAPAGDNRPYTAKDSDGRYYPFIRTSVPSTVKAEGEQLRLLLELTARVPFDDRRNLNANILDISPTLVKRFLQDINSDLLNHTPSLPDQDLYLALQIIQKTNGSFVPKNIALLFFNEHPETYFPKAYFEVVQFGDFGNTLEEKFFYGPLHTVAIEVIRYLDNLTNVILQKLPDQAQVERSVAFPYEALEEAIVNAIYHRGYNDEITEPNKIYLYPDRVEIINYPGPVTGITLENLQGTPPPVPARNRRIGEFLKELRLAEMRGTGIPKIRRTMLSNGSPDPQFDFDENRTYFRVILPAHPRYVTLHSIRENTYLWSIGERQKAISNLQSALKNNPNSGIISSLLIEYLMNIGNYQEAAQVFGLFNRQANVQEVALVYLAYCKGLLSDGSKDQARQIIKNLPKDDYKNYELEIAILLKRVEEYEDAHTLFRRVYSNYQTNPTYLQNYALTKAKIADRLRNKSKRLKPEEFATVKRLQDEAIPLLRQAATLFQDNVTQQAWSWFELARLLALRKQYSQEQVKEAYEKAIELLPSESRFQEAYERWLSKKKDNV